MKRRSDESAAPQHVKADSWLLRMSSQVPDSQSKILTERSVEKVLFLKTKPGVLLAAYADGHVRFWDAFMGEGIYLERHCGHEGGAGVIVMCTDPENQVCVRPSTLTVVAQVGFDCLTRIRWRSCCLHLTA